VINSNLSPILHRLATIHAWQTDGRTDGRTDRPQPWQRADLYILAVGPKSVQVCIPNACIKHVRNERPIKRRNIVFHFISTLDWKVWLQAQWHSMSRQVYCRLKIFLSCRTADSIHYYYTTKDWKSFARSLYLPFWQHPTAKVWKDDRIFHQNCKTRTSTL